MKLAAAMKGDTKLAELYLSSNKLKEEGVGILADAVEHCPTLSVLSLGIFVHSYSNNN